MIFCTIEIINGLQNEVTMFRKMCLSLQAEVRFAISTAIDLTIGWKCSGVPCFWWSFSGIHASHGCCCGWPRKASDAPSASRDVTQRLQKRQLCSRAVVSSRVTTTLGPLRVREELGGELRWQWRYQHQQHKSPLVDAHLLPLLIEKTFFLLALEPAISNGITTTHSSHHSGRKSAHTIVKARSRKSIPGWLAGDEIWLARWPPTQPAEPLVLYCSTIRAVSFC